MFGSKGEEYGFSQPLQEGPSRKANTPMPSDKFEGVGIFLDTYANTRHSYSFPRIMAMIGDGRTEYDLGADGEKNSAGACSVSMRIAPSPPGRHNCWNDV